MALSLGPPAALARSGAQSVTAAYGVQYQLSLATSPPAVGTTHISGASDGSWHDSGASVSLTADANVDILAGSSRYHFDNWTGDVASPPNANNPVSVTMNQARSITANYSTQYKLSLATNPAAVGTTHISGGSDGSYYNAARS